MHLQINGEALCILLYPSNVFEGIFNTGAQVRTCNLLFIISNISAKVKCGYKRTKW